jgi:Tol biopolymer transport system component
LERLSKRFPVVIVALLVLFATVPARAADSSSAPSSPTAVASRIVFERDADIFMVNADGTGQAQVTFTANNSAPSLSPDGDKIAFASYRDGNNSIYKMAVDGPNLTRLTDGVERYSDWDPVWSPDGTRIAFLSNRDRQREIYVINASGNNPLRLTFTTVDNSTVFRPAWSPDGLRLAFASQQNDQTTVYVISADGGLAERLISDFSPIGTDLSWSPDGSRMAFSSNLSGNSEIYVLDIATGKAVLLTNDKSGDSSPSWSPDGASIAFEADVLGSHEIRVVDADGSSEIQLTRDGLTGQNRRPAFAPRKVALGRAPAFFPLPPVPLPISPSPLAFSQPPFPRPAGEWHLTEDSDVTIGPGTSAKIGGTDYLFFVQDTPGDSGSQDETGILTLDLSDPGSPRPAGYLRIPRNTLQTMQSLALYGTVLFALASNGVWVLDVSQPGSPRQISILSPLRAQSIAVSGKYAYFANDKSITVVDISNLADPQAMDTIYLASGKLATSGSLLFSLGRKGLDIFDTSGSPSLKHMSYFANPGPPRFVISEGRIRFLNTDFNEMAVVGHYVYVASGVHGTRVLDVASPAYPYQAATFDRDGAYSILVSANLAYLSKSLSKFDILDISNPANPHFMTSFELPDLSSPALPPDRYYTRLDLESGGYIFTGLRMFPGLEITRISPGS